MFQFEHDIAFHALRTAEKLEDNKVNMYRINLNLTDIFQDKPQAPSTSQA
jgi:hypothetical protein